MDAGGKVLEFVFGEVYTAAKEKGKAILRERRGDSSLQRVAYRSFFWAQAEIAAGLASHQPDAGDRAKLQRYAKACREQLGQTAQVADAAALYIAPSETEHQRDGVQLALDFAGDDATQSLREALKTGLAGLVLQKFRTTVAGDAELANLYGFDWQDGVDARLTQMGLMLTKLFELIASQQVGQLTPGKPSTPASWKWIPYAKRTLFGRGPLFERLTTHFADPNGPCRPVVLTGLPGVGKTSLAAQYAYQVESELDYILWVTAETEEQLLTKYRSIAHDELHLPGAEDPQRAAALFLNWLEVTDRWLLVIDNVQGPDTLAEFGPAREPKRLLPRGGQGRILITSRATHVQWNEDRFEAVQCQELSVDMAAQFLTNRTKRDEPDVALALAELLDGLPLALEQAAAYIKANGMSINGFLNEYKKAPLRLLAKEAKGVEYPESVARMMELILAKIAAHCPPALSFLRLCSCLAPDGIHRDWVAVVLVGEVTEKHGLTAELMDVVREALQIYSLVEVVDDRFSVHRLVQEIVRHSMKWEELTFWWGVALELVCEAYEYDEADLSSWGRIAELAPHVHVIEALAPGGHARGNMLGALLTAYGAYQGAVGEYALAKSTCWRALAIKEAFYDSDHPEVGKALVNLANQMGDLGDAQGSRELLQRALRIFETSYGPEDPHVAMALCNLAISLGDLGDAEGARVLLERALKIEEAFYDPDHPEIARTLTNLAHEMGNLGDIEGAKGLLERALQIFEVHYVPDHPELARALSNLAIQMSSLGNAHGAKELLERALRIESAFYGPDHVEVAATLNNMASLVGRLGDAQGAKALLEKALDIREAFYGPGHSEVAKSLSNLATQLRELKDSQGAKALLERALRIKEAHYRTDHPEVAITLGNLANVMEDLGDLQMTKLMRERSYAIFRRSYGPTHPFRLQAKRLLLATLTQLGDEAGAERLLTEDESEPHIGATANPAT